MQKPPAGQPVWRFLRETAQRKLQHVAIVKPYKIWYDDIRVKSSKSRLCLHEKTFEPGTRPT